VVALLDEQEIEYHYREYRTDPLSEEELRELLSMLGVAARELLRRRDPKRKELGLDGNETDNELIPLMSAHPTLLQRPIGVIDGQAVVGRPPERILDLVRSLAD